MAGAQAEVLVEVVRNGFVEGRHRGHVVVLDADGEVRTAIGDATSAFLPRSCNKPLQALGMVELGLRLPADQLALVCASHSGEDFHVAGVRVILAGAGLAESALRNTPRLPLQESVREAAVRAGAEPSAILADCSGKHAGMLATCVLRGWDTAGYLDPEHPLQQALAASFSRATGEPIEAVAVDGCGAPLWSTSPTGLARAFARLATSTDGPEAEVAAAIRSFPENVSGSTRDERRLLAAIPGAIAKSGAEASYAVALPDGQAFVVKIDDGGHRAPPVVMAALLERAGVGDLPGVDLDGVRESGRHPLLGGGVPVGQLRAVLP